VISSGKTVVFLLSFAVLDPSMRSAPKAISNHRVVRTS